MPDELEKDSEESVRDLIDVIFLNLSENLKKKLQLSGTITLKTADIRTKHLLKASLKCYH
jgi:hypothetical protein